MEDITEAAKYQWRQPLEFIPPREIVDPRTVDLPIPPYPRDPDGVHHKRVVAIGLGLEVRFSREDYFWDCREFLNWSHCFLDVRDVDIRISLYTVNLWRSGRPGQTGGPFLIQMQAEIVVYAWRHRGDLA